MKIEFLTSATEAKGYPRDEKPEVIIAGRSNAGKSSFINALAGRTVAKVSQTPGKTRLLNFFNVGSHYRLVDVPGYGYAARSGGEQKDWMRMIESYLHERENLVGFVLIMDIRRKWTGDEQMLMDWAGSRGLPSVILLNKSDKVGRGEMSRQISALKKGTGAERVFAVSSAKRQGVTEAEDFVFRHWIKGAEPSR